jgi:site-specific DNA-methyltransferase (adenine-specific)
MTITKFETLFSSKGIEWETPIELFNQLDSEFHFTLDPCCTKENAKCSKFYTIEDDGLSKSWDNEVVFVNPPYGKTIKEWVKKSSETKGIVVMLLPARTDTKYFHDYIYHKAEIRFIKGRLKFGGNQNGSGSAPFPSMICIFKPLALRLGTLSD